MTLEEQLRALLADHGLAEGGDLVAFVRDLADGSASRVTTALATRDEQVRGALATIGLASEGDDLLVAIRSQADTLAAQRRDAGHGAAWHKALIKEAAAEAVRALGNKWTPERAQALEGLAPEELIERRDSWAEMGDALLKGGRATVEGDPPNNAALPDNRRPERVIPLSAYRTRNLG